MIYRHAGQGATAELPQAEASCVPDAVCRGPAPAFAVGGGGLKLVWGNSSSSAPTPCPPTSWPTLGTAARRLAWCSRQPEQHLVYHAAVSHRPWGVSALPVLPTGAEGTWEGRSEPRERPQGSLSPVGSPGAFPRGGLSFFSGGKTIYLPPTVLRALYSCGRK